MSPLKKQRCREKQRSDIDRQARTDQTNRQAEKDMNRERGWRERERERETETDRQTDRQTATERGERECV